MINQLIDKSKLMVMVERLTDEDHYERAFIFNEFCYGCKQSPNKLARFRKPFGE